MTVCKPAEAKAKAQLVEERASLTDKLDRVEKNPVCWLEPAEKFLNALSEATLCVGGNETKEKAKLLKKTGSNLKIQDRQIQYEFNEPWKTTEKHGRFAQPETRAAASAARVVGEIHQFFTSAERGGYSAGTLIAQSPICEPRFYAY